MDCEFLCHRHPVIQRDGFWRGAQHRPSRLWWIVLEISQYPLGEFGANDFCQISFWCLADFFH